MRRKLLILVALTIIAVLAVVIFSLRNAPTDIFPLPNGTQLQVLGTRIGSATFTTEKTWHTRFRKLLPARWAKWIPSPTAGSCSSGTNSLTVYVRLINPANAAVPGRLWENYSAIDDHGFEYQREGGSCTLGGGTTMQVHGLILRTYPRRQARFKLQLFDAKGAVVAKLDVANPVKGPFPEWQSSPLPQTQTNGPVALTLKGLQENERYRYVQPQWQLAASDPVWIKARVRSTTFIDATGNEGQWLSPREKVWRVRAQAFRERLQDFSKSEYLAITSIAIPGADNFVQFAAVDRNGVSIGVEAIAGPGVIANTNGAGWHILTNGAGFVGQSTSTYSSTTIERLGSRTPFILLELKNVQADDEIEIKLHDEAGRLVKLDDSQGYGGFANGRRMYMRGFTPAADAKALNLEVIVNRPLQFEFMVNPADVKSAQK